MCHALYEFVVYCWERSPTWMWRYGRQCPFGQELRVKLLCYDKTGTNEVWLTFKKVSQRTRQSFTWLGQYPLMNGCWPQYPPLWVLLPLRLWLWRDLNFLPVYQGIENDTLFYFFFFFLRQVSTQPWLSLSLICRPGWP